jgi:guanylate kinase
MGNAKGAESPQSATDAPWFRSAKPDGPVRRLPPEYRMSLSTTAWTPPEQGALFVVTGASGTGKTTLVKRALAAIPGLCFSVSATTRPIREGESDGVDYHFLDREAFMLRVENGDFLEWAEVYGNCYGTLREPVQTALASGNSILLDIDTQGAEQVRSSGEVHTSVFILPPNLETLRLRLAGRATDSADVIERRIREANDQLREAGTFDCLVVNDDLESAHDQFQAILVAELLRTKRHCGLVEAFRN